MKTVVVASENPVKIAVAKRAFAAVFPVEQFEFIGVKSLSGVPDQPREQETKLGAHNRLRFIKEAYPTADYWISQEGGLFLDEGKLCNRAWIMVADTEGGISESSTASFVLPKEISTQIHNGLELSDAADMFFKTHSTGTGSGVIGHLTEGLIDRTEYYVPAAIIALSQVRHSQWYK